MKIKKQVSILFALLMFLAVFSISLYSGLSQRKGYIQNEISNQAQLALMLENTLTSQYYSLLHNQINQVLAVKTLLKKEISILKHIFLNEDSLPHNELVLQLKSRADDLQLLDSNLIYVHNNEVIIKPQNSNLLNVKGKYTGISLLQFMIQGSIPSNYYYALEHNGKNYMAIIEKVGNSSVIALCKDISDLVASYDVRYLNVQKALHEILVQSALRTNSNVLLVNAKNLEIIDSSVASLKGNKLQSNLSYEQLNNNYSGKAIIDNTDVFTSIRNFNAFNWYVITYRNYKDIIEPAYQITAFMLLIGIIVLIIALIIALYFTSKIVKSLDFLTKKAKEISKANLIDKKAIDNITKDLLSSRSDEVGDLSRAFVTMASSLKSNVDRLISEQAKSSRIEGELEGARTIQLGMLPSDDKLPNTKALISAAYLVPAKEVGGDFFDAFALGDDQYIFTVGDVSDKGIPAALFMSMTMTTLRLSLRQGLPLQEVIYHINNTLAERNPNMMFVTLYVVKVDAKTCECEAINAGHCFPIVFNEQNVYELDTISGPAVGAIPDVKYKTYNFKLHANEGLIIYSDGVSEAQNINNEFFSVERILQLARKNELSEPKDMLEAINKDISSFRGKAKQSDDITALCFKIKR